MGKIKHFKTLLLRKEDKLKDRKWFLIDADNKVLGKIAAKAANILRGKESVKFTPSVDSGDFVVVVNAEKIKITGDKKEKKKYYSHSGYPGGLKEATLGKMLEKHPEKVIMKAVKGMLPKGRLGRKQITKCKVFAGTQHKHQAQKLQEVKL